MDIPRRKFFGLAVGGCALPLVGAAKALNLMPKTGRPEPIKLGSTLSSADMNARFDVIWKAISSLS